MKQLLGVIVVALLTTLSVLADERPVQVGMQPTTQQVQRELRKLKREVKAMRKELRNAQNEVREIKTELAFEHSQIEKLGTSASVQFELLETVTTRMDRRVDGAQLVLEDTRFQGWLTRILLLAVFILSMTLIISLGRSVRRLKENSARPLPFPSLVIGRLTLSERPAQSSELDKPPDRI